MTRRPWRVDLDLLLEHQAEKGRTSLSRTIALEDEVVYLRDRVRQLEFLLDAELEGAS